MIGLTLMATGCAAAGAPDAATPVPASSVPAPAPAPPTSGTRQPVGEPHDTGDGPDTRSRPETGAPGGAAAHPSGTWAPGPGEVRPEIKLAAAAFIRTGGTWTDGAGPAPGLTAAGVPGYVAATAAVLDAPGAASSSVRVIYPQYGGIAGDRAAVLVLFDQQLGWADGTVTSRQLALDLRLVRLADGGWVVERVNSLTSLGPQRALTETARAVLAQPRLQLSAPALLDVQSGRMDDRLLRVLLGLASEHTLTVQVMHTGHIQTVFPSARRSNHAVGRAADIRLIDAAAVVDPATPDALLADVMRRAGELGATEVGGPVDLDGPGSGLLLRPRAPGPPAHRDQRRPSSCGQHRMKPAQHTSRSLGPGLRRAGARWQGCARRRCTR